MKFVSQYESLHLTIESRQEVREGREVTITPGLAVQFKDGVFETKDKELIKKLQSAPNYRKDFGPERKTTEAEKKVAPKSRKPRVSKPQSKKVVPESNPNMTDTKTPKQIVAKASKKSAKLNKEELKIKE